MAEDKTNDQKILEVEAALDGAFFSCPKCGYYFGPPIYVDLKWRWCLHCSQFVEGYNI